jgi:NTP pyrophosphatase (non-canonical NTP hydrolase)
MNQIEIINAIVKERKRQDYLHPHNKKEDYFSILMEEVGEIATAIQHKDRDNMIDEIIHAASVCVRWLESL